VHSMPLLGGSPSEYCHPVWYGKTRMVGLSDGEKTCRICVTVQAQYRRVTDRRTDILPRHSPRYAHASRGKNCKDASTIVDYFYTNDILLSLCIMDWSTLITDNQITDITAGFRLGRSLICGKLQRTNFTTVNIG